MTQESNRFSRWVWGVSLLMVLFLTLPGAVLVWRGISTRGWERLPEQGVSQAIGLTGWTTGWSTAITLITGTPLAYVLARGKFRGRRVLIVLVELPIVLPPTVAGLALLLLYGQRGALGTVLNTLEIRLAFTTTAVIFAQVFISAPFYIRAAQSSFESIPPEIEEAACVDGAGGVALFRWITLPLAWNGLAAGLTLSWARALGEFGATVLFAGNLSGVTQTLTLFINTEWESNLESAVWASMILLGLAFVALTVSGWFSRRQAY